MAGLSNLANLDYVDRVNRAIDYVTQNLGDPLQLEDVAAAACFSPFHFHRIFRALMGETLASFIKRVRLERSVYLLSHMKRSTLTDIALSCGFASSSDFSRAFRGHYGLPPSRFDVEQLRRSGMEALQAAAATQNPSNRLERLPEAGNRKAFAIALRRLPPRRVAYIRVHRPYEGNHVQQAATRLLAWADTRGLADGQWLGYQWDDPEIVALERCRYDVGLVVPDGTRTDGDVSITEFPAFQVAEIEIKGSAELELDALHWLYLVWLPTSGYVPAHQPMFEAFDEWPFAHGTEHFELRVQIAVTRETRPV